MSTDPTDPQALAGYRITLRNVIGISLMTVLIFVLGGVILVKLDPSIFQPERAPLDRYLWFSALLITGVLVSTGYVLAVRTRLGWGIVGLTPPTARWVLIAVGASAAMFFAGERLDAVFDIGVLSQTRVHLSPSIDTEVGLVGLLMVMGVLLPIPLEIYFRGVLFTYLRNLLGEEAGIGISALIYGLTYFNPVLPIHVAYGVVHGAVFAVLYARSGSLWTAIAANGTLGALVVAKAAWG